MLPAENIKYDMRKYDARNSFLFVLYPEANLGTCKAWDFIIKR